MSTNGDLKHQIIQFFVHQAQHEQFNFPLKDVVENVGSYRQKVHRHMNQLVDFGVLEKMDIMYSLSTEFIDVLESISEYLADKTVPTYQFMMYAFITLEDLVK